MATPVAMEPLLGYHPCSIGFLTSSRESGWGTMSGGEFDWGGRLRKGIGGAQRFPSEWLETIRRVQRQKGA